MKKFLRKGAAALLVFALVAFLAACSGAFVDPGWTEAGGDEGGGGSGGLVTEPEVINGFYGVTTDGRTIEIIITSRGSKTVFSTGNSYVVKIDGREVSRGTVTASNGSLVFNSINGSSVSSIDTMSPGAITITASGGTVYSGKVVEAEDYYYCIGAPTNASKSEIEQVLARETRTPEDVYIYCTTGHGTDMFFDWPETKTGSWEEMKIFAKKYGAPDSVIYNIAKVLKGKVSAVDWYHWSSEGYNIMFYISRMPLW
ncbi:MAG: hypothetical protein LBB77_02980 [Treponema sp.]|jgi:hypothetical protein|nr:hypothetical protein [Treponema sp.]